MALLTTAQLRDSFETDLVDDAIQRLLDDAESEIDELHGGLTSQSETEQGLSRSVFASREINTITSVTEWINNASTVLTVSDYRQIGTRELRRLADGTNGRTRWGDEVVMVYVPTSDANQRTRVQLDLAKLAIQYQGTTRSKAGADLQFDFPDYEKERQAILSRLQRVLIA